MPIVKPGCCPGDSGRARRRKGLFMIDTIATHDKMSYLKAALLEIEIEHTGFNSAELTSARRSLPAALRAYTRKRFELGGILFKYRNLLKTKKCWTQAARVIANAISRDERTVYRIVKDFELAIQLDSELLSALAEQSID